MQSPGTSAGGGGGGGGGAAAIRLWRPAAQRHVRNAWASMHAERAAWATASSASFLSASALVNLALSSRFMATMDLGVLRNMNSICQKARDKMGRQQEGHVAQLLARFDDQVQALSKMLQASKSMRAYRVEEGPLIMYSTEPSVDGDDLGDGAGAPVFATLPLAVFEKLAEEIVAMYETELQLKFLLMSEFWVIIHPEDRSFCGVGGRSGLPDLLEKSEPINLDVLKVRSKEEVQRETYQVYLTTLLIEVNINKERVEEIFGMVNDEMIGHPTISAT